MLLLLKAISSFLACLPRRAALRLGSGLGWVAGGVVRFRRREALEALRQSFPDASPRRIRDIANRMYRHLGMNLVDMARLSVLGSDAFADHVHLSGEEHLRAMAAEPNGVLALMGHIGNWELGGYLSQFLPQQATVVVKPMRSRALQAHVDALRAKTNLEVLPHRNSYRTCLKRLKSGGLVAIILDQNRRPGHGVFVNFMGRPANTTVGLAILAAQTRTPVYPVYAVRREDLDYDLVVLPAMPPPPDRQPETLREATQRYTQVLEDIIRRHPDQWIWIHRRWRTQPDEA